MCLCASPLVAALVLACGARDPAVDAAADATPDPTPDAAADAALCALEVDSVVVDLNVHPDGAGFRFAGDTTTAANTTATPCGGETSPDVLHRFVAPTAGFWRFDTEATSPKWDTVLGLRARCDDDAALACNDDAAFPPLSQVSAPLSAGEVVFVVLDGRASGVAPDRGAYVLTVSPR
jgi:hypothetical protein